MKIFYSYVFLLSLLLFLILSVAGYGKQKEAFIINTSVKDNIFLNYNDIFLENHKALVLPGDSLSISFNENSFSPVLLVIGSQGKSPVLAILPGDIIEIHYEKKGNSYEFSGSNPDELAFLKKVWKSNLSLRGSYHEMLPGQMPASMKDFLSEWEKIKLESEDLMEKLETLSGTRPEIREYLTKEIRLRVFSVLLLPAIYHKQEGAVARFPQFYQDTVAAYAQQLLNIPNALPVTTSELLLYALRGYVLYKVINQGQLPTYAAQYAFAKKEYNGLQKEWVCYSILNNAKSSRTGIKDQLKDYRSWVPAESRFLRKLAGEEAPLVLHRQVTASDVVRTTGRQAVILRDLFSSYKGKVVYIDFWASWCMPCIMEFPASEAIRQAYRDKELVMVYLSTDKDAEKWRLASVKHLKGVKEQYRFEDESTSRFIKEFGIKSLPRYMIFDKEGDVRFVNAPRPGDPELKEILDKLLVE